MTTLTQLISRCARRTKDIQGVDTSSVTWGELINDGYFEVISASPDWPFLDSITKSLTVTAGTNSVALPTDVSSVTAVYNNTAQIPMDELTGRRSPYDVYPSMASSTGVPEYYRVRGGTVEVFPYAQADTSLWVEYASRPAALTANDSPIFPAQYHGLLVNYALGTVAFDERLYAARVLIGSQYIVQFERGLAQMKVDLLSPRGDSYTQINDNWS